jgi:hypothetical protein
MAAFIYYFGAAVFAVGIACALFAAVDFIERGPRK